MAFGTSSIWFFTIITSVAFISLITFSEVTGVETAFHQRIWERHSNLGGSNSDVGGVTKVTTSILSTSRHTSNITTKYHSTAAGHRTTPTTPIGPQTDQCGHQEHCSHGPDQGHCCPLGDVFQCVPFYGDYWFCDCPSGFYLNETTERCMLGEAVYSAGLNITNFEFPKDLYNSSSEQFANKATNITRTLQYALNNTLYSARVQSFIPGSLKVSAVANVVLTPRAGVSSKSLSADLGTYLKVCPKSAFACFLGENATLVSKSYASHFPCEYTCSGDTTCVNKTKTEPYRCACKTGFVYSGTETHLTEDLVVDICKDTDECADNTNLCGTAGTCINIPGSHVCVCQENYYYNATSHLCVANSACNKSPCKHGGHCSGSGSNDYLCKCGFPYGGKQCDSYITLVFLVLLIVFGALFLLLLVAVIAWAIRRCLEDEKGGYISSNNNIINTNNRGNFEPPAMDIPGFATFADLQQYQLGKQPVQTRGAGYNNNDFAASSPPLRPYSYGGGDQEMRMLRWLGNSTSPLNEAELRSGGRMPKALAGRGGGQLASNSAFLPPPAPVDAYGGKKNKNKKHGGRNNPSPYLDTSGIGPGHFTQAYEPGMGSAGNAAQISFGGYDNSGYIPRNNRQY